MIVAWDIGDNVPLTFTARKPDGSLADATLTVVVTRPDATTASLTVSHDGTGQYSADVPATMSGRWRWKASASGAVVDVDHGFFDVLADPPARLDPLATMEDITARLGRDLTDAEAARVVALLASASARVRAWCRQTFTYVADDVQVLRAQGGTIRLPQRPVGDVTAVVALGSNSTPDVTLTAWSFDGIDVVDVSCCASAIINLPEAWYDNTAYGDTYRVTNSHGWQTPPDDVVDVVASMAIRALTAPSMAGGVVSETIGTYSYRLDSADGGVAVRLTDDDKAALDHYRPKRNGVLRIRA